VAIYEYSCKKCEKRFDLMRPVAKRDDPAVCPNCKSRRTARNTITAFAVRSGASPDIAAGEGDWGDFDGGDDDHGHDHGPGGHSHGGGLDMGGDDFDF
jgi:putative FmdB family regulatory protein